MVRQVREHKAVAKCQVYTDTAKFKEATNLSANSYTLEIQVPVPVIRQMPN